MSDALEPETAVADDLRRRLAADPGCILEAVAAREGVGLRAVVACLPDAMRGFADGRHAEAALLDIAEWGEVTMLVHTEDLVLECRGAVPRGSFGRGYYNLGGGSPIGGHLKLDRCAAIAFVRRPFMGSGDSCAAIFFNREGGAMFKVFVGRDAERNLRTDQVARFVALRDRLCGASA